MANNGEIKSFIKDTLGCQCSDDLFDEMTVDEKFKLQYDILLKYKINVGNRLLIYMLEVDDEDFIQNNLSSLFFLGKNEKEIKGFNRFRLVIVSDNFEEVNKVALDIFNDIKIIMEVEDTIHLHILDKGSVAV